MFININKYTFSYVTFLIVKKKKEGGEHVLLSQTILFSYKNFKKMKIFWKCILFLHFFQTRQCKRRL